MPGGASASACEHAFGKAVQHSAKVEVLCRCSCECSALLTHLAARELDLRTLSLTRQSALL